jgi:hypothetical protein
MRFPKNINTFLGIADEVRRERLNSRTFATRVASRDLLRSRSFNS